ncbi:heme biosynthesis protein HemY [Alphaproteobacteria bacterium LSUCC0684]
MIRRILSLILLVAAVGTATTFLVQQEGVTVIEWLGWRIEIRTSLMIAVMLGLIWMMVATDRLFGFIVGLPDRLTGGIRERRRKQGHQALALGLVAASVGDHKEAQRQSKRASHLVGKDMLTDLLNAQVATLEGDNSAASRYFQHLASTKESSFFGHAGLMRLNAENGEDGKALVAGREAFALNPKAPALARALFVLEAKHGNWKRAITALLAARRHGATSSAENDTGEFNIDHALSALHLEQAKKEYREGALKPALKSLDEALRFQPGLVPAALLKAELLHENKRTRKALATLENAFLASPHPALARTFVSLQPEDNAKALARLTRLSGKVGNPPEAALAAAQTSLDIELWGEARRLVETIPMEKRDSRAWTILANVANHAPEDSDTEDTSWPKRDACLIRAATAPRPAGWTCDGCGDYGEDWHSTCPSCGRFASLTWK